MSTDLYNTAGVEVFEQDPTGLNPGNAVYFDTDGTWKKARADSHGTLADGIVILARAGHIHVWMCGPINLKSHGLGTAGQTMYLSPDTAGAIDTTQPDAVDEKTQILGKILSADRILFMPKLGFDATLGN